MEDPSSDTSTQEDPWYGEWLVSDLWILLEKGDDIVSPQLHGMLSNAFFVSYLPGWDSDGIVDNTC